MSSTEAAEEIVDSSQSPVDELEPVEELTLEAPVNDDADAWASDSPVEATAAPEADIEFEEISVEAPADSDAATVRRLARDLGSSDERRFLPALEEAVGYADRQSSVGVRAMEVALRKRSGHRSLRYWSPPVGVATVRRGSVAMNAAVLPETG